MSAKDRAQQKTTSFTIKLQQKLREAGVTQSSVEHHLGWSAGYLSQLLSSSRQSPDLKIWQAYAVLEVLQQEVIRTKVA